MGVPGPPAGEGEGESYTQGATRFLMQNIISNNRLQRKKRMESDLNHFLICLFPYDESC